MPDPWKFNWEDYFFIGEDLLKRSVIDIWKYSEKEE